MYDIINDILNLISIKYIFNTIVFILIHYISVYIYNQISIVSRRILSFDKSSWFIRTVTFIL